MIKTVIYQTGETVFYHISKQREESYKHDAQLRERLAEQQFEVQQSIQ